MHMNKIEEVLDIGLDGYNVPEELIKELSKQINKQTYTSEYMYFQELLLKAGYNQEESYEILNYEDIELVDRIDKALVDIRYRNKVDKKLVQDFTKYIKKHAWGNSQEQLNEYPNLAQSMLEYMDVNELDTIKELIKNAE